MEFDLYFGAVTNLEGRLRLEAAVSALGAMIMESE